MVQKNGKLEPTGKVKIENLRRGTYYVYETKAAPGYDLETQRDYYPNSNDPYNFASKYGYVYLGSTQNGVKWTNYKLSKYQYLNPPVTLIINKKDTDTNNVLNGAKFKIYAILKDGTKGWVSGDKSGKKTYGTTADEYESKVEIKKLRCGTYYIYETTPPIGGEYDLKAQNGYKTPAEGSGDLTGDWVFLGKKELDGIATAGEIKVSFDAGNQKSKKLVIKKVDETTGMELSGGKFKIYAKLDSGPTGWVKGEASESKSYEANSQNAGVYNAKENIEKLEYGTYYIYEIEAPVGYNITKQKGYKKEVDGITLSDTHWVYLDKLKLGSNSAGTSSVGISGSVGNAPIEFRATNQKVVSKLEGHVWLDKPDTKANKYDNVLKKGFDPSDSSNSFNDERLKGIDVTLYDSNHMEIATAKTNSNGYYKFESKNSPTYTGEDKNLYYWEIANYYVEFTYDNTKYICVDPFAGNNVEINSKAQEETMTIEELDDNKLTGTTGSNPGKAVTYKSKVKLSNNSILDNNKTIAKKIQNKTVSKSDLEKTPLTGYYNDSNYTISNINLGLTEKLEPDFTITEDVAYMKVKFGENIYKYEYMNEDEQLKRATSPTVNQQNSTRTFTGRIYPSDVAYNIENPGDQKLKVYMVYRIYIYNNTTHNIDNNYIEERMYIQSLTNFYDTNRYKLSDDSSEVDQIDAASYFRLWSGDSGEATCNGISDRYSNGIKPRKVDSNGNVIEKGYATAYIQFQLTENAVKRILAKDLTEEEIKGAPSTAKATTFHEYWRADNVWKDSADEYYNGHKQTSYDKSELSDKTHYLHKSKNYDKTSSELYMRFDLPKGDNGEGVERTIKGKVFEDGITEVNKNNAKALGNGIIDDNENNVSKVVVELVNVKSEDAEPETLYQYNGEEDNKYKLFKAVQIVQENGEYEFKGVIPGYYYIRFTYGNGKVKYKDIDGNDVNEDITSKINDSAVKIQDYKSTIINTEENGAKSIIKDAMESTDNSKAEWYKDLDSNNNYSTAVDDLNQRDETDGYIYHKNGDVYNGDTKLEESDIRSLVDAYTPQTLITIENDKENVDKVIYNTVHEDGTETVEEVNVNKPLFSGFNFGIIKAPDIKIIPKKFIKNITLTNQVGTNLVTDNPKESSSKYLTSLAEVDGGSTYAKMEIESNLIYGSGLIATYEIDLENKSDYTDYVENDKNSGTYGFYYKYGISEYAEEKEVKVEELQDVLDTDYDYKKMFSDEEGNEISKVVLTETKTNKDSTTKTAKKIEMEKGKTQVAKSSDGEVVEDPDGSIIEKETECITFKNWSGIKKDEKVSITYDAKALLSSADDDKLFINNAEVTKISLSKLTTLTSGSYWHKLVTTRLTITPPTGGQDKGYTIYIISGTILIVMGVGILLIKKFVL